MTAELNVTSRTLNDPSVATPPNYKPSIYNHFIQKDDAVWGVNLMTSSVAYFPRETFRKVEKILAGDVADIEPTSLEKLKKKLLEGRFLIAADLDEIELLKMKNRINRFAAKGLTLIVAPTLRCNFACDYCYVDRNANKMKAPDRVKLAKFFERKLAEETTAEVVWTGGDPSLAMDVVEDLSWRFLDVCERKRCSYQSCLITNGYLLDDGMREKLKSSRIDLLQVSLDGARQFHDGSRCLPSGKPTYDRILENVNDTCDDFTIMLRINVDSQNHHAVPELLDDLERRNLKSRLFIYFAQVDDVNENSSAHHDACLTIREYARLESSWIREAVTRGFKLAGRKFTKPVYTFCGANSYNYYVVDPNVSLLKCYHDFGAAHREGIGRIGEDGKEVLTNLPNLMKWLGWDPFQNEECLNCKILPLCMGGCSHKIMNSDMQVERGCLKLRFSIDEIVTLYGERKRQGLNSQSSCSGCAVAANVQAAGG